MRKLFPEIKRTDILLSKMARLRDLYLKTPLVSPRQIGTVRGDTPLHLAARYGSYEVIEKMSEVRYLEFTKTYDEKF